MDLCSVVGMNGLDWDGEEEAEWLWLLPGGTPVGPEAASQTRTELGAKNPEKNPFSRPLTRPVVQIW